MQPSTSRPTRHPATATITPAVSSARSSRIPEALRQRQQKGVANPNKGKRFPIQVLSEAEVRRMIEACGTRPSGIRNAAMVALIYRSGVRSREARWLGPHDLHLEDLLVTVIDSKTDKERAVVIDVDTVPLIERWVEVRADFPVRRDELGEPLFFTLQGSTAGRRMQGSLLRELLPAIARRAGVTKRVHPHGFRHSHASELTLEGVSLNVIQRQLGHRWLSSTQRYTEHFGSKEMVAAIGQRRWRSNGAGSAGDG